MREPARPRWCCYAPGCPLEGDWQPVSAMGEFDDVDVALADLEAHYASAHPEPEEVSPDGARVLAA